VEGKGREGKEGRGKILQTATVAKAKKTLNPPDCSPKREEDE